MKTTSQRDVLRGEFFQLHIAVPVLLSLLVFTQSAVSQGLPYRAEHLFTLDTSQAELSYRERPTPTLAVDAEGNIAFPTHQYTICLFSPEGECLSRIIDSSNVYPKEMLFDDFGVLQVLAFDESEVIKYPCGSRTPLPLYSLEDWWQYSDTRIAGYLEQHTPERFERASKGPLGSFLRFPYYLEIYRGCNLLYVNGSGLVTYDVLKGTISRLRKNRVASLGGVLGDHHVLRISITNSGYVLDLRNKTEFEIKLDTVRIRDSLPSGYHGNFPESNKRNLGMNWYWQRGTFNVYKVVQLPTGFRFFKISFGNGDDEEG